MASIAANAAESKKAIETVVLETGKVSYLADYFVICSGESPAQIKAITESIKSSLEKMGMRQIREERDGEKRWFLLDYGDVVIHVFHKQERSFYQLEQFWNHANVVERELWAHDQRQAS
ncbi:MAG: ribosome silencing factor [Cyanobacteria bacterium]|nr:ribosome silencing factor [Cyanobacteriota bacterium]